MTENIASTTRSRVQRITLYNILIEGSGIQEPGIFTFRNCPGRPFKNSLGIISHLQLP